MKKIIVSMHEKIAVRAYYAWLNGSTVGADADWLASEAIEQAYAERRAVAARKAAETRKAKAATKVPSEMLVANGSKPVRRPTAY